MTYDVRSTAEYLHADLAVRSVEATTPIDDAVRLGDFAVASPTGFATLVIGAPRDFIDVLDEGSRVDAMSTCVAVVAGGEPSDTLSDSFDTHRISTIVVPEIPAAVVHPRVLTHLAVDQAAEDRRVTTGTKVLTQVARRGGIVAVVAELAHRIDGWAVLLDVHGETITTAGAGGLHVRDAVAAALHRPVRIRHPGLQIHPVGQGEDISAHLVIGARGAMSRSRDLASAAAALLDLLMRTADNPATERLGREVMVSTLLRGGSEASALLRRWGVHENSLTAFAVASRSRMIDPERLAIRWLDELGAAHVLAQERGHILGFIRDDRASQLADIVDDLARNARMPLRLGIGSPAVTHALARSAAEATQALENAVVDGRPVVWYQTLATVSNVLAHLDRSATTRIAALLDPLRDEDGRHGQLTRTLREYLAQHGAWGSTAARLGVHRQTHTSRIHRIEELTGLSMSNPDDRTAAWLAIRALENTTPSHVR